MTHGPCEAPLVLIDYNSVRSLKSFNQRVRHLVIHYTALDFAASVAALTGPSVSAHYLVPDPTDPSYTAAGFTELRILNLVDETHRAWHAGVSAWAGRTDLNDTSIGIENVNLASEVDSQFNFPPYDPDQIDALIQLARSILQRYPDIRPTRVLGHADVAIGRKSDPGPRFPWKALYEAGVGAWYEETTVAKWTDLFQRTGMPSQAACLQRFAEYGYVTAVPQKDGGITALVRAFQMHFRPARYDGLLDVETAAILYALVEKYVLPG